MEESGLKIILIDQRALLHHPPPEVGVILNKVSSHSGLITMDEGKVGLEDIAGLLTELIVELRESGKVSEDRIKSLESLIPSLGNETLEEHLEAVVRCLKSGGFEERSILGKSIRLSREELELVMASIDGFVGNEPFREMDSKCIMDLWKLVLSSLIKKISESEELFQEK